MTSRNSMLRCPASSMYSIAEATSPDMGPPADLAFPSTCSDLIIARIHSRSFAICDLDLGQGSAIRHRFGAILAHPGRHQLPGDRQSDRPNEEADNSMRESSSDYADEDDECRRRQASTHHKRFQYVV